MSDLLINPVKKSDPHVLTFAPLRVVFKTCDHRRFRFTPETCLSNNHKYDLMNVENRLTTKQKSLKTL